MQPPVISRHVIVVRTDVPEEYKASVIEVERISEPGRNVSNNEKLKHHPDDEGDTFLQNIGSNNSHTAAHPKGRHSYKVWEQGSKAGRHMK
jgi:hypothetical protein